MLLHSKGLKLIIQQHASISHTCTRNTELKMTADDKDHEYQTVKCGTENERERYSVCETKLQAQKMRDRKISEWKFTDRLRTNGKSV